MATLTFDARLLKQIMFWSILGFLLYWLMDIAIMLFIAYIIMAAIMPAVKRFEEYGLPRWASVVSVYLVIILIVGVGMGLTFGPFLGEMQRFFSAVPMFVQESIVRLNIEGTPFQPYILDALSTISKQLATVPLDAVRFGASVFGGVLDVIMMLIFTFYFSLENERIHKFLVAVIPTNDKKNYKNLFTLIDSKLGSWLRGELILMTIIGVVTYLILRVIGLPFALPLAIIAGILEIVPIIGPIISAIPAILVALAVSPVQVVVVVVAFILIQQLEGSIVVPRVMKHAVGLDPRVVLIALLIGGKLGGPMGALLSVPVVAVIFILYNAWVVDQKLK